MTYVLIATSLSPISMTILRSSTRSLMWQLEARSFSINIYSLTKTQGITSKV